MENKEAVNKEALLNKALESEYSVDARLDILMDVAQDCLKDKLFYIGCVKIYAEAGDIEAAEDYRQRAEWVDEKYLNPLTKILGEIKLSTWDMEPKDVEEIKKYFGDEYFDFENEDEEEWEEE